MCLDLPATVALHLCQRYTFDLKSTQDLFCITSYTAGFRDHIAPTTHSHGPLPDNTREIWSFPMFSSKEVILLSYDHPEPCLSTRWTDFEADSYTYLCIPVMIWRQKLNVGVFVSLLTVHGTVYIINADGFVILQPSFASNGFKPNSPALKCILQHIRECETQLELESHITLSQSSSSHNPLWWVSLNWHRKM